MSELEGGIPIDQMAVVMGSNPNTVKAVKVNDNRAALVTAPEKGEAVTFEYPVSRDVARTIRPPSTHHTKYVPTRQELKQKRKRQKLARRKTKK